MPKTLKNRILAQLADCRILPLFYQEKLDTAKRVIDACYCGGGRIIEFTNRGPEAPRCFEKMVEYARDNYPDLHLGAGTITDASSAILYIELGAEFLVSPFLDEESAAVCEERGLLYIPGCATPREIHLAEKAGAGVCKIFPAPEVGGPSFIKAVLGPSPNSRLMPTGGISPTSESIKEWLDAGAFCLGLGSQLIPGDIGNTGQFDAISIKLKDALNAVVQYRRG